jgi:hypothetical protein
MNVDVVAVAVVSAVVITGSSHRLAFRPPVLRRMDGRARFKTSCFVGLPVLQYYQLISSRYMQLVVPVWILTVCLSVLGVVVILIDRRMRSLVDTSTCTVAKNQERR